MDSALVPKAHRYYLTATEKVNGLASRPERICTARHSLGFQLKRQFNSYLAGIVGGGLFCENPTEMLTSPAEAAGIHGELS